VTLSGSRVTVKGVGSKYWSLCLTQGFRLTYENYESGPEGT